MRIAKAQSSLATTGSAVLKINVDWSLFLIIQIFYLVGFYMPFKHNQIEWYE
jgi:hypothetical protein